VFYKSRIHETVILIINMWSLKKTMLKHCVWKILKGTEQFVWRAV